MMTERHHCLSWSSSRPGVGDSFWILHSMDIFPNPNKRKSCLHGCKNIQTLFFAIVAFVLFSRRTPEEVIAFVLLKRCCDQCDCCNDTDARSERNANWWDGFLLSRQTARHSSRFQLGFMKILRSCAKRAESSWEAQTADLQLIMCQKIASRGLW